MERHGEIILTGKTEELGGKPVPVPLCPPHIPHGITQASAVFLNSALDAEVYSLQPYKENALHKMFRGFFTAFNS
jgi:hypothetical protein